MSIKYVDNIDKELIYARLIYLVLTMSIIPSDKGGLSRNESKKSVVLNLKEKLESSDTNLRELQEIDEVIKNLYQEMKTIFKNKIGIKKIAIEYNECFRNDYDPYSSGIEYGLLNKWIDLSRTPYSKYLPYHTRIGLMYNAGGTIIEENYLLTDAFLMLLKTENCSSTLQKISKEYKNSKDELSNEKINNIEHLKQSICSYSRLGLLSFYSFAEAFINSIGFDYYKRNEDALTDVEKCKLQGFNKRGNHLNIQDKIQYFQEIIIDDNTAVYVLKDKKQLKEPFVSFLETFKEIRDSSVHYSPIKAQITRVPADWIKLLEDSAKLTLQVSKLFWQACYPNEDLPQYLFSLDYKTIYNLANERLNTEGL